MTELLNTLYVQTQGAGLYLDHDSVRIRTPDDESRRTLPLRRLDAIVVYGHVNISSELQARCAEDGRSIVWMSRAGRFLSRMEGPVRGNVLLRHAQHQIHDREQTRLAIARAFIAGKIQNSRQIMLRGARDVPDADRKRDIRANIKECETYLADAAGAVSVDQLMGIEGKTAQTYYEAFGWMLRPDNDTGPMRGRNRRPPTDPVNALLSFLYGLTRSLVHGAAEQVGLDPYVGFLHSLRPGKPALALDLMEEFRPVLADRLALTMLNRHQVQARHFETLPGGAVNLTDEGRTIVLTEWQRWKQREWKHKLLKRGVPAALLPVVQARLLARHLRGELSDYLPWIPA
ncbi:type I-C CRISPR-associated endonuclease Cas1c [Marinitenerispora sediminis]|uniref:CRISPR-associated endonuclease Cas1 n=1 Tax=Marinitenerispora sediminis TaxID=1931232 RepID=A0A368T1A4_9ACTN|nr:type I-C CRISPR-associated endonuclease Cas1c [Marinitenerispora sediminis]RCV53957.1 subtype I-C CRISPR-associated endonuclease Cas1 [Marinitenerispora sediminis]RCV57092.1 subtype I-C CRISPR-associated endonuclease Cas1 [Marinitenerispora sediminis]RCV58913.1 subtype I-C CRISPR-associated endonuclease Cas1 [Marinitenerispora sediminis]